MTEILGYILTGGIAAGVMKILDTLIAHRLQKKDVTRCALLALLHDRLYSACTFYLDRGWCSAEDKRNLEYMFRPYEKLGGNGTCKAMYNQCMSLTMHSEHEKEEQK